MISHLKKSLLIVLVVILAVQVTIAQSKKPSKKKSYPSAGNKTNDFLQTQWWLGVRAGLNKSFVNTSQSWSAFSPINYSEGELNKQYKSNNQPGWFAGLDITFYHKGFSIATRPNVKRQYFSYNNYYHWFDDENPVNTLHVTYDQLHSLDYIELPISIKYDITRSTLRPNVRIGAYYAFLLDGQKKISVSGDDRASGSEVPFEGESLILGVKELYNVSTFGLLGGVGVTYDIWNIRLTFDAEYRYGLNNIVNEGRRFSNNQLAGIGDAMDDLSLNSLTLSFGIVFPLRYISNDFSALD